MKSDRLFQMIYLLLESDTMTARELSEKLEVSVRTVYRDVETLSGVGVPIYATSGRNGGIWLLDGYQLKMLLANEEQDQLLFAIQSFKAADQKVDALLEKLGNTFRKPARDWIAVDFTRWGMQQTDRVRFEMIRDAILQREELALEYCSASGETTQRRICPLRLLYKDRSWYLQAFCLKAMNFRLFKMSRILELSLTGDHFSDTYEKDIPQIEMDTPIPTSIEMRLCFDECLAFRVYDEFDRESIDKQPDGSLLVEVHLPMDDWVLGYLFSFGTHVEVLGPLALREELSEYALKIAMHHKT